jgi:hypothetical protein
MITAQDSAENYRAVGSFPPTARQLPVGRILGLGGAHSADVTAAFATVADAVARRNPYSVYTTLAVREPGLRGGELLLPDARSAVLHGVRFVSDPTAEGRVVVDDHQRAHAEITIKDPSGTTHRLTLLWRAFPVTGTTPVTGTFDAQPFVALMPLL